MRIALVSETYPPEINGVALTVHALATGLAGRGHTVEILRPRQRQAAPDDPGVLDVPLPGLPLPGYPGLRLGLPATHSLCRRWRRWRPDVLYIATEGPLGHAALTAARRLGIPAATGFHTRFDSYAAHYGLRWLAPWVRACLRRFHRRADATLVPTEALAEELRALGVPRVCVLRRAVDTTLFHPQRRDATLRAHWGADGHTPVWLYVGRLAPEKNLALAVRAFEAARQVVPRLRFVLVGDGPARARLAADHPELILAGVQRGEALARHYASADLFVFPSLSETFGNVILEALAAGLPVIAHNQAAAREHVREGHSGHLVEPGDEAGFIEAATRLSINPGLIRHMGRAAHAATAALSPATVIADAEALLGRLAEGDPHVPATIAPA
ncbi:glycosyltransferase family 4 protein [Aerosticca soli]|uniref:Glycosyltransferase n=1 Tax=Aerosticca soli TaxID=2010829 RepID=A0A2Z6E3L0_9GAMM|nr:glycosyltransferase family 1 protein [Aerosticca soli]BBD79656.1 glycosyltransferase [Aerosticca soli]